MITGININETQDYVSKFDQDKKNPTVFKIGCLDPMVKADIEDEATSFEISSPDQNAKAKASLNYNKRNILVVKFGLRGLVDFIDPATKKPVRYNTVSLSKFGKNYNVVSDKIIALLPSKIMAELAELILSENRLGEEERKN